MSHLDAVKLKESILRQSNTDLKDTALLDVIEQLEAAEQRMTLMGHDMDTVRYRNGLLENKITQLEAELARRDAAAGEPEMWEISNPGEGTYFMRDKPVEDDCRHKLIVREWFTAAQPAALPKEIPAAFYKVLYDECGGFVDCTADASKIWDSFRKLAKGLTVEGE